MAEPTSTLTFEDLILEVALQLALAYYGVDGDEAAQIPIDAHDLAECKRTVNKGIRMFIADGPPPDGWRWTRPTAQIVLWGSIDTDAANTVTAGAYDSTEDETLITAVSDSFYPSMELKTIAIDGTDYTIKTYVSATQVYVEGDASTVSADTWSITADGNYTLPQTFGGMYSGAITYASDTNQGVSLSWSSEAVIRQWRENITDETGDPYLAAIRPMATGSPRRRWELMVYPKPDEVMTVEFPYNLHFDSLVALTEVPPAPFSHDETIRAACLAIAERDTEDAPGPDWEYYKGTCLGNSRRIDAQSAPRKLGYFGNRGSVSSAQAIQVFRNSLYQRPNVAFNP